MHPQSESLEFIINKEDSGVFHFLVCNIILAKIKQTNKKNKTAPSKDGIFRTNKNT